MISPQTIIKPTAQIKLEDSSMEYHSGEIPVYLVLRSILMSRMVTPLSDALPLGRASHRPYHPPPDRRSGPNGPQDPGRRPP
ncbi:hypothetical protein TELCIR_16258, partial [Teladorsagia circumcincta]